MNMCVPPFVFPTLSCRCLGHLIFNLNFQRKWVRFLSLSSKASLCPDVAIGVGPYKHFSFVPWPKVRLCSRGHRGHCGGGDSLWRYFPPPGSFPPLVFISGSPVAPQSWAPGVHSAHMPCWWASTGSWDHAFWQASFAICGLQDPPGNQDSLDHGLGGGQGELA